MALLASRSPAVNSIPLSTTSPPPCHSIKQRKFLIYRSSCFEDAETERGCVPIVFRLWGQRSKVSRSKPKATKRETCLCLFRRIYLARTITCLFCSAEHRPRRWPPLLMSCMVQRRRFFAYTRSAKYKSQWRWLALLILPGSASLLLLKAAHKARLGHQRIRYACYVFLSRYEYAGAFITAVIVVPTFLVILPKTNNLSAIVPFLEIWLKTRAWRHIIAGKDILLQPLTAQILFWKLMASTVVILEISAFPVASTYLLRIWVCWHGLML